MPIEEQKTQLFSFVQNKKIISLQTSLHTGINLRERNIIWNKGFVIINYSTSLVLLKYYSSFN